MGKFEAGNPGRPKGAKNKVNSELRELIQKLFDDNYQAIQDDLEALEPKDRLKFLSDLLPYLLPKLQSTTHTKEIDLDGMTEEDLDRLIDRIIDE
jgi:vacuolar-type H+-ATPase subunit E/Vma4